MNKIILKGKPYSTNLLYRHHGKFTYMSELGRATKKDYQWQVMSQWKEKPIDCEIEMDVKLYFNDNRRRDIDNYSKILNDSMNRIVFNDDCQIKKVIIEKFIDKLNPRTEVIIKKL